MRYVGRTGARQSSAGGVTYVCSSPGTGLLRTCNLVRISSLAVLRNDGQGVALPPLRRTASVWIPRTLPYAPVATQIFP
ncbi:MAG: hypothetical protein LBM98_09535 [Oscillospiraceae bacterium]|nr:hypothetical protein [Oscillospiraceae bacterium]